MKRLWVIASFAVTALLYSCEKNHFDTTASLKIPLHTCSNPVISGNRVSICFDTLLADPRCPPDAVCFWPGFGVGSFSFSANGNTHRIRLAEVPFRGLFPKDTIVSGYKIEFLDLELDPAPVPHDKTRALMRITKQ